jgi:hypothetical protein
MLKTYESPDGWRKYSDTQGNACVEVKVIETAQA